MALLTLGTSATTSLSALLWKQGGMSVADLASFNAAIKSASLPYGLVPTTIETNGILNLPNDKGTIQLSPGDYIAYDSTTGWPIVISARAIAAGPYAHS